MKFVNKLRAFFMKEEEPMELDLVAAEIKEGRAFLHTKGENEVTYMVRSHDIRILLSEGKSLSDMDIISLLPKKQQNVDQTAPPPQQENKSPKVAEEKAPPVENTPMPPMVIPGYEKYKKRTFSVSLYPDEYSLLIASQKEYGYKRADFVLACVQSAKKTALEKAHKQIVKDHKQMLKEQKSLIESQLAELETNHQAI